MKIASWNCGNKWNSNVNRYDNRKYDKMDLIRAIDADVIFLSEVAKSDDISLWKGLKDVPWIKSGNDQRGVGFYCRNNWKVEWVKPFCDDVVFSLQVNAVSPDGRKQKILAIWSYPGIKYDYLTIIPALYHANKDFLDSETVIIGDFNICLSKENPTKNDCKRIEKEEQMMKTIFAGFHRSKRENMYSFIFKRKLPTHSLQYEIKNKITMDHVFVPDGMDAQLLDNSTYLSYAFKDDQISASDHLPIIAEIR